MGLFLMIIENARWLISIFLSFVMQHLGCNEHCHIMDLFVRIFCSFILLN
jgi:hypothetical protein